MVSTGFLRRLSLLLCLGAAPSAASVCTSDACDPLCVEVGRYRVTDQVVEDTTGDHLSWQRRVSARLPWDEAASYCACLELEGRRAWRLPTPVELAGIRYKPGGLFPSGHHFCVPSIDQAAFPETPADLFWTAKIGTDDTAWYVGFDDGRLHRDTRTEALWVRCTHDG
jgi:hypothetical protein